MTDSCAQSYILADEDATVAMGQVMGQALALDPAGCVAYLQGDLGAGKTTFTRGVLRAFGHLGAVKSPTYTLVEEYSFADRCVYHFDLYRLNDPEELEYMGIRDYFAAGNVCLVEWSSRGEGILPSSDIEVTLVPWDAGRCLRIDARSVRGQAFVKQLAARLTQLPAGVSVCACANSSTN